MKIDGVKKKKCEKFKNVLLFCHFTQEIFNWGVFLPITTAPKYSNTVPNLVNDTQDFMCMKFKALLPCKLHPNNNLTRLSTFDKPESKSKYHKSPSQSQLAVSKHEWDILIVLGKRQGFQNHYFSSYSHNPIGKKKLKVREI